MGIGKAAKNKSRPEFGDALREAVGRWTVFWPHAILILTVLAHTWADPQSTELQKIGTIPLFAFLLLLGLGQFFNLARIYNWHFVYLVLYHFMAFFGLVFLTDIATPYTAAWFFVVFLTYFFYGRRGLWISTGIFALAITTKLLFNLTQPHTLHQILNVPASFFAVLAGIIMFISLQKVFEWEHRKLQESSDVIKLEQKRLARLINNMTESVVALDKNGNIQLYNAALLGLVGANAKLTGKPFDRAIQLEDLEHNHIKATDLIERAATTLRRDDITIRYGENDFTRLEVTITPIDYSIGTSEERTYVMTLRDITHEKSLEEERNEFISVISHELRTPVAVAEASISNALRINSGEYDTEAVEKSLEDSHRQVLHLADILNDLATLFRAEQGRLSLQVEPFSPGELATSLVSKYRDQAAEKGLQLTADVAKDAPDSLISNRPHVQEIIENFLTNAIKYTSEGSVEIKVSGAESGVRFTVTDTGIGISRSDQKRIFEKFFRSEDYKTRNSSGTGLGLYITAKLAKIIKAHIALESQVGQGSMFSVTVPNMQANSKAIQNSTPQADSTSYPADTSAESV